MTIRDNLANINEKIQEACNKSGRKPEEVTIIAVTKYSSIQRAEELLEAGIRHLGENRDREFLEKYEALQNRAQWHFIGTLQSRKVKGIINHIDYLHSLDRLSLAKEIHKRREELLPCFVQVNVSGEESKHGLKPEETLDFIEQLAPFNKIQVIGLMTMAPLSKDEHTLRKVFSKLKELQLKVQEKKFNHAPCHELSMGMSNDFEIAIEEGATMVRLGTALVGKDI